MQLNHRKWGEKIMKLKKLLAAFTAAALVLSLAGCAGAPSSASAASSESASSAASAASSAPAKESAAETESEPLRVAGLKGPTTMGLVNLLGLSTDSKADENGLKPSQDGSVLYNMYGAADELVPLLVKGDLDAACVPANLAATLYNKTQGAVQVACINTLGVLYVVEKGDTVQSMADLKGKTLVTTGKGTTPEYVLRYLLSQNGIDPDKDVTMEYTSEATEALAKVQAGEVSIAMLPQPFVTAAMAQTEGLRVALDMNAEWQTVAGTPLVTGVLLVRKDAVEADPARFADFMEKYKQSTEQTAADPEGTAALCEAFGVVAKAALAQKALPQCNIVFETGDAMKSDLTTYYQILFDADPTSVGGALPGDDFYYAG